MRTQSMEVSPPPMTTTLVGFGSGSRRCSGSWSGREVAAHEEVGRLVDAGQRFALDAHLVADAGASADEDGVEFAREHVVERDVRADVGVADELDAERLEVGDVFVDDRFAHLEVGDAVDEHAAGLGPEFVDRAAVASRAQLLRRRRARPGRRR